MSLSKFLSNTTIIHVESNGKFPAADIRVDNRTARILSLNNASLACTRHTPECMSFTVDTWKGYTRSQAVQRRNVFPSLSEIITGTPGKKRSKVKSQGVKDFSARAFGALTPTSSPTNFIPSRIPQPTKTKTKSHHQNFTPDSLTFEMLNNTMCDVAEYLNSNGNADASITNIAIGDGTGNQVESGQGSMLVNNKQVSLRFVNNGIFIECNGDTHRVANTFTSNNAKQLATYIHDMVSPREFSHLIENLNKTQSDFITKYINNQCNNNITHIVSNQGVARKVA